MHGPTHGLPQDLIFLQLGDELPNGAVRISNGFLDILGGNRPRRRGGAVDIALPSYLLVNADYLDKMTFFCFSIRDQWFPNPSTWFLGKLD